MTHGNLYSIGVWVPRVLRSWSCGHPDLPFQMQAEAWHRAETPACLVNEEKIMLEFLYEEDVQDEDYVEGIQGLINSGASVIPKTTLATTPTLSAPLIPIERCMRRLAMEMTAGKIR